MSVEDRIALAQDIWDSVAIEAGLLPASPSEKAEIDRRLAEDDAAPDDTISWDTIKSESQSRWKKIMRQVVFRRQARREFDQAGDWYEKNAQGWD